MEESWESSHHSGDGFLFGHSNDFSDGSSERASQNWMRTLSVARQGNLSLDIRKCAFMKFRWWCHQICRRRDGGLCSPGLWLHLSFFSASALDTTGVLQQV